MKKVMCIVGTRPEAIKMAPVIRKLKESKDIKTIVVNTGQHREMTDQVLKLFKIKPDYDLDLMKENQDLAGLATRAMESLDVCVKCEMPDYVLVQGDTTSAFCGALVAFYNKVPVGHVEAGLRTYSRDPYPEEANRRMIAQVTTHHFAPTVLASNRLYNEAVCGEILVSGNTVVDAIELVRPNHTKHSGKDIVLVTAHRRENFVNIGTICDEVKKLVDALPVEIVFPVHPNPNVRKTVYEKLDRDPRILLIEPLNYIELLKIMDMCKIIVTDSGGLQEEAPSFNKPVLVLRESTERPEGVRAGVALVTGPEFFVSAYELLTNQEKYDKMANGIPNPYGDGNASERIVNYIVSFLTVSVVDCAPEED
jgi:UDP-N-acetylglucosamine 2-epimerase (non-hydrolysing)